MRFLLASEFTDYLVAWGTIGLGATTLLLALATIRLVGHTRASAEISRAGVEAEVQPILVDVPPSAEAPTDMARDEHHQLEPFFLSFDNGAHKVDAIDPRAVSVTRSDDALYVSVPFRNVGRGLAKLTKATLPDIRGTGEAVVRRVIVPVGESTRVDFVARGPEDGPTAIRAFESGETSLAFEYTDVGGGQAFALTADLASTDGGAWYLTRLRHRQVLRRHVAGCSTTLPSQYSAWASSTNGPIATLRGESDWSCGRLLGLGRDFRATPGRTRSPGKTEARRSPPQALCAPT